MSNVLVVEADAIVRNLMIRVLSQQGFTVYEAANTKEALELCRSFGHEPLDLLIADYATSEPGSTAQILDGCANTKVLHISERPIDPAKQARALAPGSSFLKKPFTPAELLQTVHYLLNPRMQ